MQYVKEIDLKGYYDFVVCGGGMTGFACAVAAARKGLKTALVEKQGCLGGVATSAGVNHLLGGRKYDTKEGKFFLNVRGIYKEVCERLITKKHAVNPDTIDPENNPHGWFPSLAEGVPFDGEMMKILLEEMCMDAGVEVYYFTDILDTVKKENRITSILVHNKSGLFFIEGRYFADTTGDADIAALSGCVFVKGREEDGLMTPVSLEMHVDNVDTGALGQYIHVYNEPRFKELIKKLREKGEWTFPYEIFIAVQLHQPDVYMINTIRQIDIDGTDGASITKAMIEGREENLRLFHLMKKYFPGFANARIRSIAPIVGVRETRRIIGEYTMTVEDLSQAKNFQDSIAVSSYGWDLPDPKKPSYQPLHENNVKRARFTHIPYSCLLPSPINNLIVAGRSISVERDVLGPIRVMAPCIAMGEAAGMAASLANRDKVTFSKVDVIELQALLQESGCVYHIEDNVEYILVNKETMDQHEQGLCGC